MLTKKYKNGFVTLRAKKFPPVAQEAIDREIKNFEPARVAVEKLYEYEQKNTPKEPKIGDEGVYVCPNCGTNTGFVIGDKCCEECGQALDWNSVK